MQQAARVSQKTAFFHLGKIVEYDDTEIIFTNPKFKQTQDYITGRYGWCTKNEYNKLWVILC